MSSTSRSVRGLTRVSAIALAVLTGLTLAGITAPKAHAAQSYPTRGFHAVPANLASLDPGTIIRTRPVAARSLQLLPLNVDAWQILYRTTGEADRPDVAVTTLLVPRNTKPTKLLSFQAATDSVAYPCAPSYQLTEGAPIDFSKPYGPVTLGNGSAEVLLAAAGLAKGWAVAFPDHGGSKNTFLTPHQPGFAVLDGIRAVQAFKKSGITRTSPTALWGYSGGAIASSWAIEEQPTYAPELNIVGAAFGAPERDLAASLKSVNFTPLGGLIPIALGALGKDSPEFKKALGRFLKPGSKARIADTLPRCVGQNILGNLWYDYRNHLNAPVDVVLADPVIKKTIAARGITGRAPAKSVPTYIYNGVTEEVAPIRGTDRLVRSYCKGGANVTYRREQLPPNPVPQISSTHGIVLITGAPAAFHWLTERMEGKRVRSGCDIRTVPTTAITHEALSVLGPSFIAAPLAAMLGLPVGS